MTQPGPTAPAGPPDRTEIPADLRRRLEELGGGPTPLYRALASSPVILRAWVEFAYAIRGEATTPRRIRELMILRSAQMMDASYQWRDHVTMGRRAGVRDEQVEDLGRWENSPHFSAEERAALRLAEAMLHDNVTDDVWADLRTSYSDAACIELVVTAGFYTLVPRILHALRLEPGECD